MDNGAAATVVYSADDAKVVEIAAGLFAEDVQRVSGMLPSVKTALSGINGPMVLIGTIGHCAALDTLIEQGKVDISAIQGGWEQYRIEVVENPFDGVPQALVIAGSDRRGTAYGVFSLSEAIGVSPWVWWADAGSETHSELYVDSAPFSSKTPSVRYRGIFLNDEDWGLQEWAEKNFESGADEVKDIGPKTYAKIFELLLRLKANYCWPAMHDSTRAFNHYAENKVVADRYAIVMGSSHAEPMLRNNVDEWDSFCSANGYSTDWNYAYNKAAVYDYWEQRSIANGAYENVFTVGKRGIHDSGMVEGSSTAEKAAWLNTIFEDQRKILAEHVNSDVTQVGQIFVPYKEVLDIYDSGLVQVPDDVIMGWPDDNHGYIRRLSDPTEQQRSGGGGIYYHISYWGAPRDYLWLCSTPPSLIWEELSKAYENNCGRLWVINVGDIKPGEICMEFSMRLAWNVDRYDGTAQTTWLTEWATREFGAEHAEEIAALLNEYYRLGYERKPEQMNWVDTDDLTPSGPYPLFSHVQYGDEAGARLDAYAALVTQAQSIYSELPAAKRNVFYETVLYPIVGADGMNRKFLEAGKAYVASVQGRNTVAAHKAAAQSGYDDIQTETAVYNALESGKWNEMMDSKPHPAGSTAAYYEVPSLPSNPSSTTTALGVAVEGRLEPAVVSASGIVYKNAAGYIALNAATDYSSLSGEMTVSTISGKSAIYLPGEGSYAATAGQKGKAVYTFNVSESGTYTLSFEINCPTVNDDSWYIQMDSGSTTTWNNLSNGGVWGWVTFGDSYLSAGSHTLTVYAREDGAAMANIKLQMAASAPMVEDRLLSEFALPEFNARTRRSHFMDLFNTGSGSVNWTAESDDSWLKVSKASGALSGEERLWISVDWPAAPKGESVSSSLKVKSAGQTLNIPVAIWNPESSLPLSVDFVEENGVIAIEAENYSSLIPADDVAWSRIGNLGSGDVMQVLPTTAASRDGVAEVTNSSPALIYNTYLRSAGEVTVSARFIPTLPLNGTRGLRYAVSFDDEAPQIVDMDRTSGSGSVWRRSVLRANIEYQTTHTLSAPGEHQLKIWMVDPGVVVDRIEIRTDDRPYSYRGAPESAVKNYGDYSVGNDMSMVVGPAETVSFDSVTNYGHFTLQGSAGFGLNGGAFVNYGVLDLISWEGILPASLINYGEIIDHLRIEEITASATTLDLEIPGYSNHHYQLQRKDGNSLSAGSWVDVGAPAVGAGLPLIFSAGTRTNAQGFYRIKISP